MDRTGSYQHLLNERQKMFAMGFLCGMTATRAYQRAGYRATGASARANASRLLTNANIARFLEEQRKKNVNKLEITQEKVLGELASFAFANIKDFVTMTPEGLFLKDLNKLETGLIGAIQHLNMDKNDSRKVVSIRLRNKLGALKLIGIHLGVFK